MDYTITPPVKFSSEFRPLLPLSKSISNRALVLDALSGVNEIQTDVARCDDTAAIQQALANPTSHKIDVGAAGTAMRFLTALMSATEGRNVTIDGTERMRHRPIGHLVEALRQCGASISYLGQEGYPPLSISGRQLRGGNLAINPSVSSQFISALLMIAPTMSEGLTLTLDGPAVSTPYIYMTIDMMRRRGADVQETHKPHTIRVNPSVYTSDPTPVEPDWSAASYWLEYKVLSGHNVDLPYTEMASLQGDAAVVSMFNTAISATDRPVEMDFSTCPDLAQTFVVALGLLGITFKFSGLSTLKIKETDRIDALCREMKKLGIILTTPRSDVIEWDGTTDKADPHPCIDTYSDHRMAMSMAFASLRFPGITIRDVTVVNKSYPGFWDDMRRAGFTLTQV